MTNYSRFTKAELIGFLEHQQAADRKDNERRWALVAELNALKEAAADKQADIRELVEQQIEPLAEALETFTERLAFEQAFGPLDSETHALVLDLLSPVTEAAAAVYSVDH